MILYPAIDLKDGACVRLLRGDMNAATVFGTDPAAQARAFQDAGCDWLHLVDLNGAFAGQPVNGAAVQAILAATTGAHYRPDLANLAVARYHALARGINNAKRGISTQ
jgi:phosphoribosylformimino-5-aminoimidazole carboxamide ribonucleotide (ProFAR) isomerase